MGYSYILEHYSIMFLNWLLYLSISLSQFFWLCLFIQDNVPQITCTLMYLHIAMAPFIINLYIRVHAMQPSLATHQPVLANIIVGNSIDAVYVYYKSNVACGIKSQL